MPRPARCRWATRMPSQAEIEQQQADVDELSAAAIAEVAAITMLLTGENGDEQSLVDAIPTLWEQYMVTATSLAVDWYRGLARTEPVKPKRRRRGPEPIVGPTDRISLLDAQDFQPQPAELPPRAQLEATVHWALYQPPEPEPPADTSVMPIEDMSEDDLRREVERLRPEPAEPTPEPAAEPEAEPERSAPVERSRTPEADTEPPRARVVPADEESPRARIIPAEADERQARIISRLAGATQRYVTTAARDTVTANANAEGVRWARHAQPDACAFCRLLATRGPDYLTKESAQFVGTTRVRGPRQEGELYHDDCGCVPVPVRAGDAYEPPDYVADWLEQYEEAYGVADGDYRKILAAMRAAAKANGGSRH
ncbi:hypothetical protein [Nocardia sp. NPDC019255]|uniref:VG15 protein n=1 Tax=Nocardia sp. NPDC019255 TaxID=3154591 RepID=UPI003402CE40